MLVKVHAISLNREFQERSRLGARGQTADVCVFLSSSQLFTTAIGFKAMSSLPFSLQQKKPCVSESDLSGVVAGGNLEGTGLALGDEVFGIIPFDQVSVIS